MRPDEIVVGGEYEGEIGKWLVIRLAPSERNPSKMMARWRYWTGDRWSERWNSDGLDLFASKALRRTDAPQ